MNLIDLIVLACSIANLSACQEFHILFQSSGSLRSCMMQAQPHLAEWAGGHPGYRVVRWHCAWPDQEGGKI
ncbi:MAG: hypothetical protein ACJ8AW_14430 [Rhodopila sp.]